MAQQPRAVQPQLSPSTFFGAELRSWRQRRGLSQAQLGRNVHVSGDLIAKIEKAERRAAPDLISRLDAALDAGGDLLGAGARLAEPGEAAACTNGTPSETRVEAGAPDAGSWPQVLAGIGEVLAGCRRLDHVLGPRSVLATIAAQVDTAETLLATCQTHDRHALLSLLAQLHQFHGWLAFDQGQIPNAEQSFTRAAAQARAAGRADLAAYVLGPSHGFALTYSGRPGQGVTFGQAALDEALRAGNPRLMAFVRATTARAHARLGESAAAQRLLEQAENDLDRVDAAEPVPDWLTVFDVAALHGHRGSCLLDLGRPSDAVEELATEDDVTARCFARNRTIWLLDQATAHLHQHDLHATCQVLDLALPAIRTTSSRRIIARLLTCASALTPHRGNAEVTTLLDRIHAPQVA